MMNWTSKGFSETHVDDVGGGDQQLNELSYRHWCGSLEVE
jgi:hypothetical protein